jgi:micrococcal nuclease
LEYDESQQQIDTYGRLIAYVYLGDILVNDKILVDGYAKEYTYKTAYIHQQQFQKSEQQAQSSSK